MPIRQFKELERKPINDPDEKVEVTVRDSRGMTTAEGFKEQGETFQVPAKQARIMQRANLVDVGGGGVGDEPATRQKAYLAHIERKKGLEVAKAKAKAQVDGAGIQSVQGEPETEYGQAGMAEADSGDPAMFSGGQGEAGARIAAFRSDTTLEELPEFPAGISEGQGTPGDSPLTPSGMPEGDSGSGGQVESGPSNQSAPDDPSGDYRSKSKSELVEIAKGRGVAHSDKSKTELVEALREDDRKKG